MEKNIPIPEPKEELNIDKYSGKILLRVPKSLHRDLILKAALENVSLNAFVNSLLARGV
ncbi:MAG: toxin-antitoxin system HicB family antitoxin [Vampirovibrionia bacterium]